MCDTYAWPDVNSEAISHGRLRFYGGSKIVTKGEQAVMDEISITGKDNKFNFIELDGKEVIIRYRLNAMDWELDVDGTLLYTRDLKGKMTGTLLKKRLRFVIHNVHLLYSNIVTLFDPELRVKNPPKITKPSRRERCIQ